MPPRARRMTIKAVLETAVELEKKTMGLYALFMRTFQTPADVRRFWFNMARHEAGHCGALALVESVLEMDPNQVGSETVSFDPQIVVRLRSLLTAYLREAKQGVTLERAFEMALDVEGSELEDVVVDLLQVVRDPMWRDQAIQLLIHDLGDLSFMVEKFTKNEHLLARADALLEHRIGRGARPRDGKGRGSAGSGSGGGGGREPGRPL
jgi:rubrerythrin